MKKIINLFAKKFLFLIMICSCYSGLSQSFTNPVGDLSDPQINYIDGFYYYTGTVGNRVAIKRATTLEELKTVELITIFQPGDLGAQTDHYWSSEIHKSDGKWYVYYTAASIGADSSTQRNYVIECPDSNPLEGTWTFKGQIFDASANYYATNPTVTEINGMRYFLWAGVANSGTTSPMNIYISAMSNPWTLSGSRTQLYTSGDLAGTINGEAPSVLVNLGKVYLTYNANGCGTSDGKTGLMYMSNDTNNPLLLSSWTKVALPVFDDNAAVSSYNPNHQSFFKSPDNTEFWISYTSRFDDGPWCDNQRSTRAQKFTFDGSGIPQFGTIAEIGKPLLAPSGEPILPSGTIVQNGLYRIRPKAATGSQTLEIGGISIWGGANVGQWFDDSNEIHHKWYLQATNVAGEYIITSAFNGLAIEVGGCNPDDFANINMWYPNGAPCQKWIITNLGAGDFRLTNKKSAKVMELEMGGNNIHQNTLNLTSANQIFKLEFIESTLDVSIANFNNTITLYPNPIKDQFIVSGMDNNGKTKIITITDMLGKIEKTIETKGFDCKVNASDLKSGVHIVTITSEGKNIAIKKIVVN